MAAFSALGSFLPAVAEVALSVAWGLAAVATSAAVRELATVLEAPEVLGAATRVAPDAGAGPAFSASWYRATLFNSYHEVHAFQLGIYGGILALALRARGYRHAATAALVGLFVFSLGLPDVYDLCRRTGEACGSLPVQLKPWYFLTGLLGTAVAVPRTANRLRAGARRAFVAAGRHRSVSGRFGRRDGSGADRGTADRAGDGLASTTSDEPSESGVGRPSDD